MRKRGLIIIANMLLLVSLTTVLFTTVSADVPIERGERVEAVNNNCLGLVFSVYNPNSGEHFLTSNGDERFYLGQIGWLVEGLSFTALTSGKLGGNPVYRLYNPNTGDHHYTESAAEYKAVKDAGWIQEGIAWYTSRDKEQAVYRLYNPNAKVGSHHLTTNEAERYHLKSLGWKDEGIAFYALWN